MDYRRHMLPCGGQNIPVDLGFDRRRSLRLSVRPDGVVRVRAPLRTSLADIRAFLHEKSAWILRHLERFQALREAAPPPPAYVDGETQMFLGRPRRLHVRQGATNAVSLEDDTLAVSTRLPPTPAKVRQMVEAWLHDQARELFPRLLRQFQPRLDALGAPRPKVLRIRAMTSRWGTCSRSGTITLNRHLLRTPLECIEYVVAHELCHLRHHNHGAEFYALLSAVLPDWQPRRRRLREISTLW